MLVILVFLKNWVSEWEYGNINNDELNYDRFLFRTRTD